MRSSDTAHPTIKVVPRSADPAFTLLIVDDDAGDRTLCRRSLRSAFGKRLRILEEDSGEGGLDAINRNAITCALIDYSLPGIDGIEVLRRIRRKYPYLPVVMIDGKGHDVIAVQSMKEGAQDYIAKSTITPSTLQRAIEMAIRHSALREHTFRLNSALESSMHGLCVFDSDGRLVVCNSRYASMYGLSPERFQRGVSLRSILEWRVASGNSPEDGAEYIDQRLLELARRRPHVAVNKLRDGRFILVSHQPTSDGGWVTIHQDITAEKVAEAKLEYMAHHDALTRLPNRTLLQERLNGYLSRGKREERLAILFLDLDHFKQVNDTLGHSVGDALLCAVVDRVRECTRDADVLARLGGDEFAILQSDVEQPTSATHLAQRLIDQLSRSFDVKGHQIDIGVSIGISIAPNDGTQSDQLLKNADMALFRAKEHRNRFCFFEAGMDARMQARRALQVDLRKALAGGQFELFYQPLVNLRENTVRCFEALLRWNHPARGLVTPADFIPLAEETGLIVPIGEWVLRQCCAEAAKWPAGIKVAVNLSPVQFRDGGLVATVEAAIAAAGIAADRLELEITEAVLLENSEASLAALHQLRALGVGIAMDDFGTGYSSLSYLRSFPFDKIKIDRSFIRGLDGSKDSVAIIRAISGLGADLGLVTTAEGVETGQQLELVRALGCTEVQGYLIGRPQPACEVPFLLRRLGAEGVVSPQNCASSPSPAPPPR